MVVLLSGDDESAIGRYIQSRKSHYSSENIHEFSDPKIVVVEVEDLVRSEGLFGNTKIVVVRAKQASSIDFSEELLKEVHPSKTIELLVYSQQIRKNTKPYTKLKKYSRLQEFVLPKDYANFNISDALLITRNKSRALQLISEIEDIDTNFYGIIWTIQNGLRNYLSMKYKNKTFEKLHPFVKKKTASVKLTEEEAQKAYNDLFKLDVSLKSLNTSKLALIQDFVLYSI